jgi:hypothetical protein
MHPLHDYIVNQLAEKLRSRKIVVWYDPRRELSPFFDEVRGSAKAGAAAVPVKMDGVTAQLAEYDGSFFELRYVVEPYVKGDAPEHVIIYVPGCERDRRGSVLMEIEKAGTCQEPNLKRLAREVLRQKYTDGVIDELLARPNVTYGDLALAVSSGGSAEPPSILKAIFHNASGSELLATWLGSDARDAEIAAKDATGELVKLVRSRLGLSLDEAAGLSKLRSITLRYVLANEFRSDLKCPAPASLDAVPAPSTKEEEAAVRELAKQLRASFGESYPEMADRVEAELHLRDAKTAAEALGAIDTFRFEERALLTHCGDLITSERFEEALTLVGERERSFWLDRDFGRKAQWEVCRRMAELGRAAAQVRDALAKMGSDPTSWVETYAAPDGWFRMDLAQRRLETWVANLAEEPEERPLGIVRRLYEEVCRLMAEGFTKALVRSGWAVPACLHQTRIYSEVVNERPKPVAYLLVDAMRYEMGVELEGRLPKGAEVSVRAAVAALPSITPIGMAALQPGASASFSIAEVGGKFGARIDETFLPDLAARRKFAAARVPKLIDLSLDELLSLQPSKLAKKLDGAQVVVVRSQEIDHAGEAGFTFQARQVMATVIDNLARAIRKLAAAGVEHSVVTADHGHLFFASDRDESMRTDSPGGDQVDLHRRCWIGRGGSTPAGCVRVAASALGYASDLELVFPTGCGVFRGGGDLAFHHGGPSLQELLIPVLTVRLKVRASVPPRDPAVQVSGLPDKITTRMITLTISSLLGGNFAPLLVFKGRKVGGLFGVVGQASHDRNAGTVTLQPGSTATLALLLTDDTVAEVRVVLVDPITDAEIYRSPTDIPVRLGV